MSLRSKFTIVLTLLALTLMVNVLLSVWCIRFLEKELAWPLRSVQPVLSALHTVKRVGEQESKDLGVGRGVQHVRPVDSLSVADTADRLIESERLIVIEIEKLKAHPSVSVRTGITTSRNILARSREIVELASRWKSDESQATSTLIIQSIEIRHELIERVEGRVLQDARLAADYGQRLTFIILSIIVVSAGSAVGCGVYGALLLRRWIIEPVGVLREGAKRLGQGEFEHRIVLESTDELGQLGDEFNKMSSFIKDMQDERVEQERLAAMGEMAQRTVHNLRTPLAGIRALAETTKDELTDGSELIELQDRIMDTVDRFEKWLQGMLRVSSPTVLTLSPYSPGKLIEGVIASHDAAARSKGISITLTDDGMPEEANGDLGHLEHALTAVLSNAIDFSAHDSTIDIKCGVDARYWTAKITDQGSGIDPDLHVSIFRPYFTTRTSGTGIGLAMVKQIIEQHHGSVDVESPVDPVSKTGTAFTLRLPI